MHTICLGNRGSRPLGASENSPFSEYGGDTTSMLVVCEDETLILLDAGTGMWKAAYTLNKLLGRDGGQNVNLFLSHYHDDHTMGLAQSELLFNPANDVKIYGPDFAPGLASVFNAKANRPANPDLAQFYQANIKLKELIESDDQTIKPSDDVTLSWMIVPHGSEQSVAYRIDESNGQSLVCISDTHHELSDTGAPTLSTDILNFIHGANVMVYDCHFSDAEIATNPGFYLGMGHSSGEHGVRLCEAAGVPTLVQHHHNPQNTDAAMRKLTRNFQKYGKKRNVDVIAAKPSLVLNTGLSPARLSKDTEAQNTAGKRWNRIRAITNG